jgi:hypothetical protein
VVNVTADAATLNNGSINSSTSGTGNAGIVNVTSANALNMTRGQINSTTTGAGNAGMVNVRADTVNMRDVAVISASARSGSRGNAGTVTVAANTLLNMQGSSVISSRTEAKTQGNAGDITITAGELTMSGRAGSTDQNARITTSTQSGAGGNVNITVAGLMSQAANAQILAGADGAATMAGGTVTIKAQELQLLAATTRIGTTGCPTNRRATQVRDRVPAIGRAICSHQFVKSCWDLPVRAGQSYHLFVLIIFPPAVAR